MAVSFITRLLTLALGYAYPAYDCYKTLELNTPQMERLRFWCQYWILLAFLTAFERFADCAVSWLPMYGEAKLALVVYLWHPNTMGAGRVYGDYLRPFLAAHEADIDRGLLELRTRAADATTSHLQAGVPVRGRPPRFVAAAGDQKPSRAGTVTLPRRPARSAHTV